MSQNVETYNTKLKHFQAYITQQYNYIRKNRFTLLGNALESVILTVKNEEHTYFGGMEV